MPFVPRLINKGLVTHNRIPWFRLQKNAVTNQIQDNKNVTKHNKIHEDVLLGAICEFVQLINCAAQFVY